MTDGPMTPAPKRRWLRFSLRTLFVVVTVICVWFGLNLHAVRQREQFLRDLKDRGDQYFFTPPPGKKLGPLPISWRIVGAEQVGQIDIKNRKNELHPSHTIDSEEHRRVRAMFPESTILVKSRNKDDGRSVVYVDSPAEGIRRYEGRPRKKWPPALSTN
ncbi:MAG: hypothetical protein WD845_14620 [Pirellulales bacterium]